MSRPIDADRLLDDITAAEEHGGMGAVVAGTLRRYVMRQPTLTQPNELLTLEQVREMDGEPVWFDTIKRWGIVKVCQDGTFILTKSGEFEVGYITRRKYYRRPPEGES